jgi:hypothetical protein
MSAVLISINGTAHIGCKVYLNIGTSRRLFFAFVLKVSNAKAHKCGHVMFEGCTWTLTPFPELVPSFVISARSTSASSFLVVDSLLSFAVQFLLAGTDGGRAVITFTVWNVFVSVKMYYKVC